VLTPLGRAQIYLNRRGVKGLQLPSHKIILMSYTIAETDLERQHLLSQVLNPLTRRAFEKIKLPKGSTVADIGCGLGDTTLLLSEQFPGCVLTGLDQDADLIAAAADEKRMHANIKFMTGNALQLPFEDNQFDFVFTRYLLHHIVDPIPAIAEMKRICKPGGIILAQEPDVSFILSFPESDACRTLQKVVTGLFADVQLGRKLISFFHKISLIDIRYDIQAVLADHLSPLKKFVP
jgi:ubiquinone/menaquinone biosynthesis C-methylase UbiE